MMRKKRKAAVVFDESPLAAYLHSDIRKLVGDYCDPLTLYEMNPYDYASMRSRFLLALRDHVGIAEPEEFMRHLRKVFGIITGHFLLNFLLGTPEKADNMTIYVAKNSEKLRKIAREAKMSVNITCVANPVEAVANKTGLDVLRMYFSPTRLYFLDDTTATALRERTCALDSRPAGGKEALLSLLQLVNCLQSGFTYIGNKDLQSFIDVEIRYLWYRQQVCNAFSFLQRNGFQLPGTVRLWLMNNYMMSSHDVPLVLP